MLGIDAIASLDDFPLRGRFVARETGRVPHDLAPRLRPLTAVAATSLAAEADARSRASTGSVTSFRSDDSPGLVAERLRRLPVANDAAILIWWDGSTAMLTDWSVFIAHWGDICYPAAGDVCVWPVSGAWSLCYRRYEVLQFRCDP